MILRLTFAARIGLILLTAVGVAWLSAIALLYLTRASTGENHQWASPQQVAALAELLEGTPPPQRDLVLRAASSQYFAARIAAAAAIEPAPIPRRLPRGLLEATIAAAGGRPVSINFSEADLRLLSRLWPGTIEVRIGLKTADVLVIEERSTLLLGPFGLPVGFGAGIFGSLIALLALLVMQRETRPLARLAEAVDRVDLSIAPVTLPIGKRNAPEIRAVITAFNRLQGRLAELLRARMVMLGGISHDVRTFASRLRLRIDKISDEDERERAISDINDMVRLLDDALLASRAGAGAGELANEMVEIDEVIRADISDRQSAGAAVDYRSGPFVHVPIVLGDRLALKRVVANLTDNAIKYGQRAQLSGSCDHDDFVLAVEDDGPGIPQHLRDAMLEPFSRMEASRSRATGGAGLGLAIARSLTEAHRGTLTIGDGIVGARIVLRLPLFRA